jgi:hypothetical protein
MRFMIGLALATVCLVIAGSAGAQQASTKAVATTADIMTTLTVPASTAVFRAASEAPPDQAAWAAVRGQALVLAESGNLLLIGSRVRAGDWTRMAVALREAAAGAVKAADAKHAAALADAGDGIYETCEQCHLQYLQQGTP